MIITEDDLYLGDYLASDGSNTKNIKTRCDRGHGINTNIMIILKEVCLGQYHFMVAMLLREALLFSSLLLSAETWFNVTKREIDQLQLVDKSLMKQILSAPAKSSICSLYLETGTYSIEYVLIMKRIMFLHYILNRV